MVNPLPRTLMTRRILVLGDARGVPWDWVWRWRSPDAVLSGGGNAISCAWGGSWLGDVMASVSSGSGRGCGGRPPGDDIPGTASGAGAAPPAWRLGPPWPLIAKVTAAGLRSSGGMFEGPGPGARLGGAGAGGIGMFAGRASMGVKTPLIGMPTGMPGGAGAPTARGGRGVHAVHGLEGLNEEESSEPLRGRTAGDGDEPAAVGRHEGLGVEVEGLRSRGPSGEPGVVGCPCKGWVIVLPGLGQVRVVERITARHQPPLGRLLDVAAGAAHVSGPLSGSVPLGSGDWQGRSQGFAPLACLSWCCGSRIRSRSTAGSWRWRRGASWAWRWRGPGCQTRSGPESKDRLL